MSTTIQTPATPKTHMAPLRSYLFVLAPGTRLRGGAPVIHYVVEESPDRAIQVCGQAYPEHRIVAVRDVTDHAPAA